MLIFRGPGVMVGMRFVWSALVAVGMLGNLPAAAQTAVGDSIELPPVPREFRGVWVATVANIDWPSRAGLPMDAVHAELIAHPGPRAGAAT